jgi:hypothetical protein
MKITATELALQADHLFAERQETRETLRAWRGERPDFEAGNMAGLASGLVAGESALARISDAARQAFAADPLPVAAEAQAIESAEEAVDNDPFLAMVRQMIEFLTGEKVRVFDIDAFSADLRRVESAASTTRQAVQSTPAGGMEYDFHAVREEFEQTQFSARGTVRTVDGQEIAFRIDLEMTRIFREETQLSLRTGNAVRKDPLIVNFGGTAAQLTAAANRRFDFDLDGDGRKERLPGFASGSGYLAFDLNGNGRIDDGRELFGPQSGQGFAELARLDADGNGWIDAGDSVFERLSVWTPAGEGSGELRRLSELGIGALGLAHVATPFALRGSQNDDLGAIRSTGIYLGSDNTTGTLQEIDLSV